MADIIAFPHSSPDGVESGPGMSLRDYFAAKAMPIAFGGEQEARGYEGWREELAREAYRYADAMLKAREQ